MPQKVVLSRSMTEEQFDNGYWYATEIKEFAKEIGILHTAKLRKDELEKLIKAFLRNGKITEPARKTISKTGVKDLDKKLSLSLPIVNYTSNKATKKFIVEEALKMSPGLKNKSGARYRLNRWREEQINKGIKITYGDLVKQYVRLCKVEGGFEKMPVGRYINFSAEFLAKEKNATREQAIKTWKELKKMDIPKTYAEWKKHGKSK